MANFSQNDLADLKESKPKVKQFGYGVADHNTTSY